MVTFDLGLVILRLPDKHSRSFTIEGVGRVGVPQELWEEHFEDVDHIEHG